MSALVLALVGTMSASLKVPGSGSSGSGLSAGGIGVGIVLEVVGCRCYTPSGSEVRAMAGVEASGARVCGHIGGGLELSH